MRRWLVSIIGLISLTVAVGFYYVYPQLKVLNGYAYPDAPHDLFAADGYQGQLVFIIPSKDLVVVRLGLSDIDFNGMLKMICDNVR